MPVPRALAKASLAAKRLAQYAALSPLLANSGLTLENTRAIAQLPEIVELNIGHSIIARAVFVGLESATNEMKNLMLEARV
jgi:pyridoxine 5-phosphate synthase